MTLTVLPTFQLTGGISAMNKPNKSGPLYISTALPRRMQNRQRESHTAGVKSAPAPNGKSGPVHISTVLPGVLRNIRNRIDRQRRRDERNHR